MSLRYRLGLCCALIFAAASMAAAQPAVFNVDCASAGNGCTNLIPAAGTSGDMDPSSIRLLPQLFGCAAMDGITDVNVSIHVTHTWRGDLEPVLMHVPTGISVALMADVDGSGDDVNVTFDDEAADPIDGPPCNDSGLTCEGTFMPLGLLSDFDGIDPSGEWQLLITDDAGGDSGALVAWSLELTFADDDGDGVANCGDGCPSDPNKTSPGSCGCGTPDDDDDGDGVPNCNDDCPDDANKLMPGECGCGAVDDDADGDGVADCNDQCPDDPDKLMPGACGCGSPDDDADGDGVPDCNDDCPNDANKVDAGVCGCGSTDVDTDGDGWLDCFDNCPDNPNSDQADGNEDGIGDVCTEEPAGQGAPCAQGLLLMPMMLSIFAMRRLKRRRK